MRLSTVYALLCVAGVMLPYSQFVPFFLENGADIALFFSQAFANNVAAGVGFDLLVTGSAALVFMFHEARKRKISNWWLAVLAIPTVGFSLGLPLFLYMREKKLEI